MFSGYIYLLGLSPPCTKVKQMLLPYTSNRVAEAEAKLEKLFSAIPFPDKQRIEGIHVKSVIPVRDVLGFIMSLGTFQTYRKNNPQGADDLLLNTQKRLLEEMGVTSLDTGIQREVEYFCILASKP